MAKKVQSVTHQPLQHASNKFNSEQLMHYLHYQHSRQIIQELLKKVLITHADFNQIDTLNKQSCSPLLGPGNVDTSRF